MSKLFHSRCKLTCSLSNNYVYANKQLGPCFYVLVSYSPLVSSEIILMLRLGEYCRTIPSTSSRGLFDDIHLAFGE